MRRHIVLAEARFMSLCDRRCVRSLSFRIFTRLALTAVLFLCASGLAQSSPAPSASEPSTAKNAPEMTSQDMSATFQVNVRLVELRVIVRDAQGKAIGTLRKEDFHLFDDGKPQVITEFRVAKPGFEVAREQQTSGSSSAATGATTMPDIPERYVAYVFDDVHLELSDLLRVREAAEKNLATLQPTDRAAMFTTSGQNNVNFTDDRGRLHDALLRLLPHPIGSSVGTECPKMTYYMADLIQNKNDPQALDAVTSDALACAFNNDTRMRAAAQALAQSAAAQGLLSGDAETHLALSSLKAVLRQVSAVPGQRAVILISPGFITPQQQYDVDNIIDHALHANITISALDARGLYALIPGGDASTPSRLSPSSLAADSLEAQYQLNSASADADVMAVLADGTGGSFFQNSNALEVGFRRIASAPEYYYLLGFSPQNLKLNGRFHNSKVTLSATTPFSVQARRGYFAPKQHPLPDQQARQEIEDAIFSQEELHELPVDLHTQFFKPNDTEAKLTVLAHVDVKQLHFQKASGRNNSDLTIVSAIFDRNGNYVTGIEKILQLHLKDETLAYRMGSGLSVKSNFDVKPGGYLVRLVVRDAQGQIAAENGAVQIP